MSFAILVSGGVEWSVSWIPIGCAFVMGLASTIIKDNNARVTEKICFILTGVDGANYTNSIPGKDKELLMFVSVLFTKNPANKIREKHPLFER